MTHLPSFQFLRGTCGWVRPRAWFAPARWSYYSTSTGASAPACSPSV